MYVVPGTVASDWVMAPVPKDTYFVGKPLEAEPLPEETRMLPSTCQSPSKELPDP